MKKMILVCFVVAFAALSCQVTMNESDVLAVNDAARTIADESAVYELGTVRVTPSQKTKSVGGEFMTRVFANSNGYNIGAISIDFTYNPQVIKPNTEKGKQGVDGKFFVKDGLYVVRHISVSETEAIIRVAALDVYGLMPASSVYLLDLNWIAIGVGETEITPIVDTLIDGSTYMPIGTPNGVSGLVTIM